MSLTSYRAAPPRDVNAASGADAGIRRLGYPPPGLSGGPGGRSALRSLRLRDLDPVNKNAAARDPPTAAKINIANGFSTIRWLQSLATTYSSIA